MGDNGKIWFWQATWMTYPPIFSRMTKIDMSPLDMDLKYVNFGGACVNFGGAV